MDFLHSLLWFLITAGGFLLPIPPLLSVSVRPRIHLRTVFDITVKNGESPTAFPPWKALRFRFLFCRRKIKLPDCRLPDIFVTGVFLFSDMFSNLI